ncbi:hypothetical protein [Microbacterium sp. JZ31]|uniref:hypothetical protein n=1 Tax=Microbacterium sp. JZ31 TaxID=1906274 RepID=UPI001EE4DB86|nr:hypothetical protein [Microbacterium sp. JZ31]
MLPATRILAAVIIPFLVVASVLLVLLPGETDVTFAWTIQPPLTAMLLGAAYVGGIWFFTVACLTRAWHHVWTGFPAVVVFAALLGIATILHVDRFHAGHPSFIAWAVLYATTPFAVLAVLLVNRRRDDGRPDAVDAVIPRTWAVALATVGGAASLTGLVLFALPQLLIGGWGWALTPLTARVVGAVLTLPGVVGIWMLVDRRWSSFRTIIAAQLASLAVMIAALAARAEDIDWTRPSAWLFAAAIVASAACYVAFFLTMERRRVGRSRGPRRPSSPSRSTSTG